MENFYFIVGGIVIFLFVICVVIYVTQCIIELILNKRYKRLCILDRIHKIESDLSCFRVEFERNISNLECLINKQNKLITNQIKLISKKCKD